MDKIKKLLDHIEAMKDDSYLVGHPEWIAIVEEAEILKEAARDDAVGDQMGWVKVRIRKWVDCRYCGRQLYKGEKAHKLVGAVSSYYICGRCGEKGGLK